MGESFTDDIQHPLKRVLIQPVGGADKQLLDSGLGRTRGGADISAFGIYRNQAPAHQGLAFRGDDFVDDCMTVRPLLVDARQKYVADREFSVRRQLAAEFSSGYLAEESVGQANQDAGAIAGIGFESAAAAVIHARIDMEGVEHDLVAGPALDIRHQADAAGILFQRGVIKTCLFGISDCRRQLAHGMSVRSRLKFTPGTDHLAWDHSYDRA